MRAEAVIHSSTCLFVSFGDLGLVRELAYRERGHSQISRSLLVYCFSRLILSSRLPIVGIISSVGLAFFYEVTLYDVSAKLAGHTTFSPNVLALFLGSRHYCL